MFVHPLISIVLSFICIYEKNLKIKCDLKVFVFRLSYTHVLFPHETHLYRIYAQHKFGAIP